MKNIQIEIRLRTLLVSKGLKWVDVYQKLGWHKTYASKVLNGWIIPPSWQRLQLAQELNVDSFIIWDEKDIIDFHNEVKGHDN